MMDFTKLLPMKSDDVEAVNEADDKAIAAEVGGAPADDAAAAVAVPPLSNLIMVFKMTPTSFSRLFFQNGFFSSNYLL